MECKEKLKKAMSLVVVTRYELWRLRSTAVIEKEGSTRMRNLRRQVQEINERPIAVERRDEGLFQEQKIPREGDGEQKYIDWIQAVRQSEKRKRRQEQLESKQLAEAMRQMMGR